MLTEGVAAGHDGMVYFSDITFTKFCKDASGKSMQAGNIWKYDPKNGETTIFPQPERHVERPQVRPRRQHDRGAWARTTAGAC